MPRFALAVLACSALLLPVGGCYRYDAGAKNLTNQSVRVSLHKGRYQREISTAVLAPGASVGWNGAVNGPVFLRVAGGGESLEVSLPRRVHTVLNVSSLNGQLSITTTIDGEVVEIEAGCPADCEKVCCVGEVDSEIEEMDNASCSDDERAEPDEAGDDEQIIDLIESDDS